MIDPEYIIKKEFEDDKAEVHGDLGYILPHSRDNDDFDKVSASAPIKEENYSAAAIQVKMECNSDSNDSFSSDSSQETAQSMEFLIPFKCDQCSYATGKKQYIKQHALKHLRNSEKPFKCDQCAYATFIENNLSKHRIIHSAVKSFKCDQCSYSARKREYLEKHQKLYHSPAKPFQWYDCSTCTRWKHSPNCHESNKLRKKTLKCDQCSYTATTKQSLFEHESEHLPSKPFKCFRCSYSANTKECLIAHAVKHYSDSDSLYTCSCNATCVPTLLASNRIF